MQVLASVVVSAEASDAEALEQAEFAVERRVPPGYVLDRISLDGRWPLVTPSEHHVRVRGVAVPAATTRREAPVRDLPPERVAVNRAGQEIHPLWEHRPLHC